MNAARHPKGKAVRRILLPAITLGGLGMLHLGLALPSASAQAVSDEPALADNGPVCMTRQHEAEGVSQSTSIVATISDVEAMQAAGFFVAPWERAFASPQDQIAWRDRICTIAAREPDGFQEQFENMLGAHPTILCGMAELALGPWERPSGELASPEQ